MIRSLVTSMLAIIVAAELEPLPDFCRWSAAPATELSFKLMGRDLQLLGARALEGLNLKVDSLRKKLVAAGPIVVASAEPPRFGS